MAQEVSEETVAIDWTGSNLVYKGAFEASLGIPPSIQLPLQSTAGSCTSEMRICQLHKDVSSTLGHLTQPQKPSLGQKKGSHWEVSHILVGGRSLLRFTKLTNAPASPKGATASCAVTITLQAEATMTQLSPSGSELP